jgi:hypothetical protein
MDINENDYCLDPTAGSGGFLLEALLQVWHRIDMDFAGQPELERTKIDFALHKVFGIEIHDVLARICKSIFCCIMMDTRILRAIARASTLYFLDHASTHRKESSRKSSVTRHSEMRCGPVTKTYLEITTSSRSQ